MRPGRFMIALTCEAGGFARPNHVLTDVVTGLFYAGRDVPTNRPPGRLVDGQADQAADPAQLGGQDGQGRAVSLAPDQALRSGRLELAMLAQQPAVGAE